MPDSCTELRRSCCAEVLCAVRIGLPTSIWPVETMCKISDHNQHDEAFKQWIKAKGKEEWDLPYDGLYMPQEEVRTFLKNRRRTLSLHPLNDFIHMPKDENFSYEVLLGDKDAISQMLAKSKA